LDAVVRHNLGKDVLDKEAVEKVSRAFMKSIPILSPDELLYALIYCFENAWHHDTYPIICSYSPTRTISI